MHPSSKLPSYHWSYMLYRSSLCGLCVVCSGGLTTVGSLVRCEALPWAEAATTG